ncbi:MAG: hypothetical protein ACOCTG_06990 [Bacteroidota bacterium]
MHASTPPVYSKPSAPGISMNFDTSVSIYHIVSEDDDFDTAVQGIFALLKEAQERFPDWPRAYYLDVAGHLDEMGRYEDDFVELQQEFFFSAIAPFVTALELPLTGPLLNPERQRNDVPDRLVIGPPEESGARRTSSE